MNPEDNSKKRVISILIFLSTTMILGVAMVFYQRIHHLPTSNIEIEILKDSLLSDGLSNQNAYSLSGLIQIYQQKKWLTSFTEKDSLTKTDIKNIKELDHQLNKLIHE